MASKGCKRKLATASAAHPDAADEKRLRKKLRRNKGKTENVPFRFFHLPRELRDQIYDEVWKKHPMVTFPYRGLKLHIHYDGGHACSKYLPTWLLTNKSMLEEGLEQLARKSTTYWTPSINFITSTKPSPLLVPTHIRNLNVQLGDLKYTPDKTQPPSQQPRSATLGVQDWKKTDMECLGSAATELKTLRLKLSLGQTRKLKKRHDWTVDLSAIELLASKLEKLEVWIVNYSEIDDQLDPGSLFTAMLSEIETVALRTVDEVVQEVIETHEKNFRIEFVKAHTAKETE
ncbi:hypothetical protein K505DRAFT_362634 [Melanomma pulvis-pyrius CBS 109.77]|uniref:Uncharacterized protein n=1 Tax=Melanomma pulvis-pyrius CBS 109.77 TaxID=1314802 RepID=A0A6A6X8L4_9PLEO|nr:hypothetical protein K505DRAFT_362634 [Melanomma pulvis-pyrius CBS 109.77]